jgi:hypothetical protein
MTNYKHLKKVCQQNSSLSEQIMDDRLIMAQFSPTAGSVTLAFCV